ncbi:hypothetical protein ZWY2020_048175 [Hordeum vulgare]|nr:hypothetical protein ZWY2020_048175 [Hordeum vulgare]
MAKQVSWTPTMSKFMLTWLSDLVSSGNRTSTAFKQSQFNACASALNEHFQLSLNGDQIKNHNRTWRRKLQKIVKLKDLSGALWDEEQSMIVLDHEHYTNHVKPHMKRLNNQPMRVHPVPNQRKPNPNPCAEDMLHATILASSERIAIAIEKSTNTENNAIDGLWESMKVLHRFDLDYLAHYYAYLVDNPRVAMAFKVLEEDQKKVWVSRYVKNTFRSIRMC